MDIECKKIFISKHLFHSLSFVKLLNLRPLVNLAPPKGLLFSCSAPAIAEQKDLGRCSTAKNSIKVTIYLCSCIGINHLVTHVLWCISYLKSCQCASLKDILNKSTDEYSVIWGFNWQIYKLKGLRLYLWMCWYNFSYCLWYQYCSFENWMIMYISLFAVLNTFH